MNYKLKIIPKNFADDLDKEYDVYSFPTESGIVPDAYYVLAKRDDSNKSEKFRLYRRTFPDPEAANKYADDYESKNPKSACRVLNGQRIISMIKKFKDFESKLPTKDQFDAYEKVRSEGKYNMIMDAVKAAKEANLSIDDYINIVRNYDKLVELYPEVRKVDFALIRKSSSKISDYYEVNDKNQVICDTKDEVREVVGKIVELNDWDVEVVCNFKDASKLFEYKKNYKGYKLYKDLSKLKLNTSKVTNMSLMFCDCESLIAIPQLDTSNVTDMRYMFYICKSLKSIPELNTSNIINMSYMFYGCESLTSIPQLDTSKVANMESMFYNCTSLTTIPQLDTSNVNNMSSMFVGCTSLTSIPQLNTSKVINMSSMFDGCFSLNSIPQLNTSKVTNMKYMFWNCISLQKLDYPIYDTNKMKEIISTTGIDGKPYKPELSNFSVTRDWVVDWIDDDNKDVVSSEFESKEKAENYIRSRTMNSRYDNDGFELIDGPYKKSSKSFNKSKFRYKFKVIPKNFAYSNFTSRILKIKFDPRVVKLNNLSKFLATFKMLDIVSDVKLEDDTIILLVNTDRSEAGVSELINGALAKVASNVTYQITEEK